MRYGTLDEQGRPVYFTGTIYVDGKPLANPTREMYLAQGQKPFVESKAPAAKSGMHYVRSGWTEQQAAIIPKWRLVADPPPRPRTFSKFKIVAALMDAEAWDQVKAYIEQNGLYDLYLAAQEFSEDNEYFVQGKAALQQALGWTDEQVEAVLAAAEGGV
jgi:hypothetical protein